MRSQYVMFLGLIFGAGTLISLTYGGNWLNSTDLEIANSMSVFKDASLFGIWSITLPNVDFFFTGMKSLLMMDFGFFPGTLSLLQWFMVLVISLGALWGIYTIIISVVQSAIGRR
jgi:hypothetical protein